MDFFIYVLAALGFIFIVFLVWIFKIYLNVKKEKKPQMEIMPFKDNEAAFEMACEFMDTDIIHKKPVIALVSDLSNDGLEVITIKIADKHPFSTYASTRFTSNYPLQLNDLIAAIPYKTKDENGEDKWIFVVSSKLNPRYHMKKQMWSIEIDFIKEATTREAEHSHNNQIYSENKKESTSPDILYFKDNEGAFEVAATMHYPVFSEKSMCIGIVRFIDPQEGSGIILELAGDDEPLYVMGFNDKYANSIEIGDLVCWGFVDYSDENVLNIKAVGHILTILKPEFNPQTKTWGVKKDLTQ
ncbi:hypothetical protein [Acinetobacter rudis]|uniref:hypothetical protein n=1 Tax=Acinetobacter rudis TaxID=632955 RepID=UPI00333EC515